MADPLRIESLDPDVAIPVAFRAGMPLGSLASGYFASLTSAPTVLSVNGGLVSLVGLYFLLKSPSVRTL